MTNPPPNSGLFTVCCTDLFTKFGTDRLFFRLYYPTAAADVKLNENNSGSWLVSREYAYGQANFLRLSLFKRFFNWLFSDFQVNAVWNGAFKLPEQIKKVPVVIFSHGLGATKTYCSAICTSLASIGVLVAAVEHTDKSACATYYLSKEELDGKVEVRKNWIDFQHVKKGSENEHKIRNEQLYLRAEECCQLLDEIHRINEGQTDYAHCEIDLSAFKGLIDEDKCAIMGHSFGGSTTIAALSRDDRFKVGIGLDTWIYPLDSEVYGKIPPVPFLFINADTFQTASNIADMRKLDQDVFNVDAERLMVTLKGTVHLSQTDFPLLVDSRIMAKLFELSGPTDPSAVFEINRELVFGFLGKHFGLDSGKSVDEVVKANLNFVQFGSNVNVDEEKIKESKAKLRSSV